MTFQTIPTRIDSSSELFATNTTAYQELVATLRERQQIAIDGGHGREKSIDRHHARGKVMARDRIDLVTDDNTPFLEFSTLAAWGQYNDEAPGAGIVTGIGVVHGVPWVFIANDATIKGGSLLPVSIKKTFEHKTLRKMARGDLPRRLRWSIPSATRRDFPDRDHFGGSFHRQARMSARGLPQLSVVLGGCTAGGAYVPALSDEVIMVEGIGRIFLGGPPIVKAALGEIIDPDDLGGAVKHTRVSGVSDNIVSTEHEAYARLREICATTNRRRVDHDGGWLERTEVEPPAYPAEDIYGIINDDSRIPFDATEIIARLVDGSRFATFKPEWEHRLSLGLPAFTGTSLESLRTMASSSLRPPLRQHISLNSVSSVAFLCSFCRTPPDTWLVTTQKPAGLRSTAQDGGSCRQCDGSEIHSAHRW